MKESIPGNRERYFGVDNIKMLVFYRGLSRQMAFTMLQDQSDKQRLGDKRTQIRMFEMEKYRLDM